MSSPIQVTRAAALLAVTTMSTACGAGTFADISGTVEGVKMNANAYYFGGPFVVFTSREAECLDMAWVKRGSSFESGGEPPTDYDQNVLLFTYSNDEVVEENINVEGESLVDARVLFVSGGALTVHRAATGYIDVTEITKDNHAVGELDLTFDNGALSGSFEVEDCNNLKADR